VKETTARQLAKSEKRTNPATELCEASSDYFALAPVNQFDEVVSQSMIP
jgi:hypothetical protein